jgi:hypothetical protein
MHCDKPAQVACNGGCVDDKISASSTSLQRANPIKVYALRADESP